MGWDTSKHNSVMTVLPSYIPYTTQIFSPVTALINYSVDHLLVLYTACSPTPPPPSPPPQAPSSLLPPPMHVLLHPLHTVVPLPQLHTIWVWSNQPSCSGRVLGGCGGMPHPQGNVKITYALELLLGWFQPFQDSTKCSKTIQPCLGIRLQQHDT